MICVKCNGEGLVGPAVCDICTGTGKVEDVLELDETEQEEESFLGESGDELATDSESEEEPL